MKKKKKCWATILHNVKYGLKTETAKHNCAEFYCTLNVA